MKGIECKALRVGRYKCSKRKLQETGRRRKRKVEVQRKEDEMHKEEGRYCCLTQFSPSSRYCDCLTSLSAPATLYYVLCILIPP